MGIRLPEGRDFDRGDRAGSMAVAIDNETFARRFAAASHLRILSAMGASCIVVR